MNRKTNLLTLLLLCLFVTVSAKSPIVPLIKGRVIDENGNPLTAARIHIKGSNVGTTTDNEGNFFFDNVPEGVREITVSFLGYNPETKVVDLSKIQELTLDFQLTINTNQLSAVEVFGERYKQPEKLDAITRMPLRPSEQIQSISVISEKVITEQGALTITDVARNVPGVTLFGSYGGVRESMSLRGFRAVPVLKNGVRTDSQFQTASIQTDMQGVESVQVIKGSAAITQGVITDIGNAGGVINIVTKTPKFVNAGEVSFRAGSWGQVRPAFDVQSVLDNSQTVAFRLNGSYERADNYRPVVQSDRVYVNPSLEWRPDDKTRVVLEMDYMNENRTPVTSTVNLSDISKEDLYEMPHNKFLGFRGDNVNNKTLTYAARITRNLTDQLSIRAAYFNSSYNVDNTSTGLKELKSNPEDYNIKQRSISRSLRDDKNRTFQLDFIGRDVYTGSVKHTFQVGFDYRIADATTTNLGAMVIDTIDVLKTVPNDAPDNLKLAGATDPVRSQYDTYGIMVQEVMTINKYLKAILALRYSSINTINASAGMTRGDAWNPMAGIMVSPIENLNIFGSYTTSTSLRSAAQILEDRVTQAGPSTTKQWEVGIKSDWLDNRLRFNFTYFHIKTANLTNAEYGEGTNQPTGYYFKAGNLLRDGIEVELNGRILDNLQVMLGYAWLDARYEDSPSYVNGSAPMNAPKHTANGWVYYTVDKGPIKGLSLGLGAYYVGKRPVNEYSTKYDGHLYNPGVKPFDMPAYTTLNAQVAYKIGKVTAHLYLNNLTDALGYNSYYRGGYINQIDPRNFSAMVSYTF